MCYGYGVIIFSSDPFSWHKSEHPKLVRHGATQSYFLNCSHVCHTQADFAEEYWILLYAFLICLTVVKKVNIYIRNTSNDATASKQHLGEPFRACLRPVYPKTNSISDMSKPHPRNHPKKDPKPEKKTSKNKHREKSHHHTLRYHHHTILPSHPFPQEVPAAPRGGQRGAGLVVPPRPAPGRHRGHREVGEVPALAAEVPCFGGVAGFFGWGKYV